MASTAQTLTIFGLGKRNNMKFFYAEVKDSTRKIYLRPYVEHECIRAELHETHACCTNFCRNSHTIFHVMSTLRYILAKNVII